MKPVFEIFWIIPSGIRKQVLQLVLSFVFIMFKPRPQKDNWPTQAYMYQIKIVRLTSWLMIPKALVLCSATVARARVQKTRWRFTNMWESGKVSLLSLPTRVLPKTTTKTLLAKLAWSCCRWEIVFSYSWFSSTRGWGVWVGAPHSHATLVLIRTISTWT